MGIYESKVYDDRKWYVWDNKITFCEDSDDHKEYPVHLQEYNEIELYWENNECGIKVNSEDLFDIYIDWNWWSAFDTCYKLLLELEKILIKEWEEYGVEINVTYQKENIEILEE